MIVGSGLRAKFVREFFAFEFRSLGFQVRGFPLSDSGLLVLGFLGLEDESLWLLVCLSGCGCPLEACKWYIGCQCNAGIE